MRQQQNYIRNLFIFICCLSVFSNFARSDYNLPLFAFSYILWKPDQKIRLTLLMIFSCLIDLSWLIFWGIMRNQDQFKQDFAYSAYKLVFIISLIIFSVKITTIMLIIAIESQVKEFFQQIDIFYWKKHEKIIQQELQLN